MCSNLMCTANLVNDRKTREVLTKMLIARYPVGTDELRDAILRVADYETERGMNSVLALRRVLRGISTVQHLSGTVLIEVAVHASSRGGVELSGQAA